jgi:hypothetical protein
MRKLFSLDLRSLAVFRILLGTLILLDLFNRLPHLSEHYTDAGVLPRAALASTQTEPWIWSFHLYGGQAFHQAVLFAIAAVFGFGLFVGYRTRICAVVSWVLRHRGGLAANQIGAWSRGERAVAPPYQDFRGAGVGAEIGVPGFIVGPPGIISNGPSKV